MAIANREPLRKAGRKRGSGSSVQSSPSRHRSRHRSRRTYKGAPTPDTPLPAADEPTIDELRRARTAFFARKLNAPQKEMNKYTADQGSRNRKRELTAKSVSSRDSHIRVRKSSRRHHSDRPCSYGKRQETDSETSSVPVSCNASDTKGRSRAAMPRPTRRVSDSVASSGKGERRRTAEKPKTYRSEPRVESSLRRMPTHNGNERKTSMYVTETVVRTTRRRAVSADAAAHTRVPGPGLSRYTHSKHPTESYTDLIRRLSRTTSTREGLTAACNTPVSQTHTLNTIRVVRLPNSTVDTPSTSGNIERIPANRQRGERRNSILGSLFSPRVVVPDKM